MSAHPEVKDRKNNLLIRYAWLAIVAAALIIRLNYGLSLLDQGFLYVSEGDYTLYQVGAEHILSEGNFDNSIFLVRPPLFPLLIALTGDHHPTLIVLNSLFGALLTLLTIILARQLGLPTLVSLLAGLLVAVDPITVRYTAFLGPEALSFVAALGMMNALVAMLNSSTWPAAIGWSILAAVCLWISAYSRPSIYLIWTGMAVWLLLARPRYIIPIVVFATMSFGGVRLWEQHNLNHFGHATFSTVGPYTMVYYRAVSVLRLGEGLTVDEAYLEINRRIKSALGDDPVTATIGDMHSYLAASPAVAAALNRVSLDVFSEYPLLFAATLPVGIVRYFALMPALDELSTPAAYIVPVWNIALLGAALFGLYIALRSQRWRLITVVLLFGGYFTAGTLLVKSAGLSGRERTVISPIIALVAANGLYYLYTTCRSCHHKADEPRQDAPTGLD